MCLDDILFFTSLILCLSLGSYYKEIEDMNMKRNYGAGLGLLVTCLICGHLIFHTFVMVLGNIIILKCCNRRYVHHISLVYTWTYLSYLHYHVPSNSYMIYLCQTLALRLVGLACEIYVPDKPKSELRGVSMDRSVKGDNELLIVPSAVDILSYAYYFIGLHRGPYYRWKIFHDHFNTPFGALGDCRIISEEKLKKALLCSVGYMLLWLKFSPQLYEDKIFYSDYGTDFRYLYNIPQLLMYFLQMKIVFLLCSSVCSEAGFGVYPVKCQSLPGCGPTVNLSVLNVIANSPEVALQEEYSFSMLASTQNTKVLLGPKMKDTMRGWDMATRYWFWAYAYKKIIKGNKEVRSAFSFLTWTMWCGLSLQQMIISTTLWLYVHLESEYCELYDTTGSMKLSWNIGFSMMRMFCLLYLTPCFTISSRSVVFLYYNSIFWVFHVILLGLIVTALIIHKVRE